MILGLLLNAGRLIVGTSVGSIEPYVIVFIFFFVG